MRPIQIILTRLQREFSRLGRNLRTWAGVPFRVLREKSLPTESGRPAGDSSPGLALPPPAGGLPVRTPGPAPCLHFAPPPSAWRRPRLRTAHGAEESGGDRAPSRELPPIRPAEIADLDLDGLLHRLLDDRSAAEPGDRT